MELRQQVPDMAAYLACTAIVDFDDEQVAALARRLGGKDPDPVSLVGAAYHFVRDQISHSADLPSPANVTCKASEVLRFGEGICYAKVNLLAALLRFHGIPCGFCYQILVQSSASAKLCVHALNAVYLHRRWLRLDARGNKPGVNAQFDLAQEKLAFSITPELGECDLPVVFANPAPACVAALTNSRDFADLWANLPESISY